MNHTRHTVSHARATVEHAGSDRQEVVRVRDKIDGAGGNQERQGSLLLSRCGDHHGRRLGEQRDRGFERLPVARSLHCGFVENHRRIGADNENRSTRWTHFSLATACDQPAAPAASLAAGAAASARRTASFNSSTRNGFARYGTPLEFRNSSDRGLIVSPVTNSNLCWKGLPRLNSS